MAKKYREKERVREALINSNDLKLFSKCKRKKITIDLVNKVISRKCGVNIKNNNNLKSALELQKKELKQHIIGQDVVIDEVIETTKYIFDSEINVSKPVSLIFTGSIGVGKKYLSTLLGEKIFNNNYHYHNFSYSHLNEELLNSILDNSKNKPFYLYIFDNYENNIFKLIDKKIKEKVINSNIMFIFINTNKELIGFNKTDNRIDNTFIKIIKFNNLTNENIRRIIKNNLKEKSINTNHIIFNSMINKLQFNNYGLSKMDDIIDQYIINEKLIV
jgi:ATP-dependent Clp protease ATP-binding subunit ClpA